MTRIRTLTHVFLALGLSATIAGCGDSGTTPPPDETFSANIQKDMVSLGCVASGCHDKNSTNKVKIDTTAGQEATNYTNLVNNQVIVKGDVNSPLIKVPSTGKATSGVSHVQTLSGTKLTQWQAWITAGAPQ